jgi:hypothetical protein
MDIFFQDPNEIPLPPADVRILAFRADPYPDGRRVRVFLEVTPFQKRPSVDVTVSNAAGDQVSSISIIESITRTMEFTMHLRGPQPVGQHTISSSVFYDSDLKEDEPEPLSTQLVVDRGEISFEIQREG